MSRAWERLATSCDGMTRRLRALRGAVQRHGANPGEVAALEEQCDRLWNYLGEYRGTFLKLGGNTALH